MHVCTLKYLMKNEARILDMCDKQAQADKENVKNNKNEPISAISDDVSGEKATNEKDVVPSKVDTMKSSENEISAAKNNLFATDGDLVKSEGIENSNKNQDTQKGDTKDTALEKATKNTEENATTNKNETPSDETNKLGDNKDSKKGSGDSPKQSSDKANGFYLDVFAQFVEESLKTPFAFGQEKEKPKLKITERCIFYSNFY